MSNFSSELRKHLLRMPGAGVLLLQETVLYFCALWRHDSRLPPQTTKQQTSKLEFLHCLCKKKKPTCATSTKKKISPPRKVRRSRLGCCSWELTVMITSISPCPSSHDASVSVAASFTDNKDQFPMTYFLSPSKDLKAFSLSFFLFNVTSCSILSDFNLAQPRVTSKQLTARSQAAL